MTIYGHVEEEWALEVTESVLLRESYQQKAYSIIYAGIVSEEFKNRFRKLTKSRGFFVFDVKSRKFYRFQVKISVYF